jgi:hypothetical protein
MGDGAPPARGAGSRVIAFVVEFAFVVAVEFAVEFAVV